jgi:hypothetical protein
MDTLDAYLAARERRDQAQVHLQTVARRLRQLAAVLAHPNGVRLRTTRGVPAVPTHQAFLDESDWLSWEQVAAAISEFEYADEEWHRLNAALTPEQRHHVNRPQGGSPAG